MIVRVVLLLSCATLALAEDDSTGLLDFVRARDEAWRQSLSKRLRFTETCIRHDTERSRVLWYSNGKFRMEETVARRVSDGVRRKKRLVIYDGEQWFVATANDQDQGTRSWHARIDYHAPDQYAHMTLRWLWERPNGRDSLADLAARGELVEASVDDDEVVLDVAHSTEIARRLDGGHELGGRVGVKIVVDKRFDWRPTRLVEVAKDLVLVGAPKGVRTGWPVVQFGRQSLQAMREFRFEAWEELGTCWVPLKVTRIVHSGRGETTTVFSGSVSSLREDVSPDQFSQRVPASFGGMGVISDRIRNVTERVVLGDSEDTTEELIELALQLGDRADERLDRGQRRDVAFVIAGAVFLIVLASTAIWIRRRQRR